MTEPGAGFSREPVQPTTFRDIGATGARQPTGRAASSVRVRVSHLIDVFRQQVREVANQPDGATDADTEWLSTRHRDIHERLSIIAGLSPRERNQALTALNLARDPDAADQPIFSDNRVSAGWQRLTAAVSGWARGRSSELATSPRPVVLPVSPPQPAAVTPDPPTVPLPAVGERFAVLSLLDNLPHCDVDQMRVDIQSIHQALDRGVLDLDETARARTVLTMIVSGVSVANIDARALVLHGHRFEMWRDARPPLSAASRPSTIPPPATSMDYAAVLMAIPQAKTAAPSPAPTAPEVAQPDPATAAEISAEAAP